MEIPSKYSPAEVEAKWYRNWLDNRYFESVPDDREPFTIVIPPPNVTGVLHMGHMLNNTIQDVLIRKARMEGKNACWVPGTDHASIATEAKVVAKLRSEGIRKTDLSREEFLQHAWDWTEKHGGIIFEQLKKLGASLDWSRNAFTMDEARSESVTQVFVDLYNKGKIYRGNRMVNWDPEAQTTVSDEEVIHKDVNGKLYYLNYQIEGSEDHLTIATTRPETILGDTAICINPKDERFAHLRGKRAIVPIAGRSIPIIEDSYVDMEFGTGCLKITPAHDVNDHEIGKRHGLETIDILNADGTLNEHGLHYQGQDRFAVRKAIAKELEEKGHLLKVEDYSTSVGTSERTGAIIEPRLSLQWFVSMKEISGPALDAVMNNEVRLIPEKFKNTYRHWMENVRDWCISRQLWWGHQIPAWYFGKGPDDFVVAMNEGEALELARQKSGDTTLQVQDLQQDQDVVDTWFSSWLWPIAVFDGIRDPENPEFKYYYPTNDLVTAPEILFFWVARMIIAGYEWAGEKPFSNVYLTGIVRDKQGRKMSKSLGNSPDPIELIGKYGADGVRVGMLLTSPAGNDLPFDEELCEQGRNFSNKIWNAFRLVKSWNVDGSREPGKAEELAMAWFEDRFGQATGEINDLMGKYRISEALMATYKLVWDDFCSWYLEAIKPAYGSPIDRQTHEKTIEFFERLLGILHPFMPFITEEIWHFLTERPESQTIMFNAWPEGGTFDQKVINEFKHAISLTSEIRNFRQDKGLSPKEELTLIHSDGTFEKIFPVVSKLANVSFTKESIDANQIPILVDKQEYFIPLTGAIDIEAEREKLDKELEYLRGFLAMVDKKLSNEKFVSGAPEKVVEMERKKKADAEEKIQAIEKQMTQLINS
ncbi:MAG: valine--tRNA ligase [Bacteroidota bacterium]|nr:valine--tRNA ligase [Bacteroidota bacterium]